MSLYLNQMNTYLFFWGHSKDSKFGFLSNWYDSPFENNGVYYPTSEHYMMYQKSLLMGDLQIASDVLKAKTPKQAKMLGRKVKNWDEELWIENREQIMYDACLAKFQSNPNLLQKLLDTAPKNLVEASPYDKIWGIGMKSTDKGVNDPKNWKGLNLLGKTLDRVRNDLQ